VTTHTFKVVVEPDEGAWYAYCPALVCHGGATWGTTRVRSRKNPRGPREWSRSSSSPWPS